MRAKHVDYTFLLRPEAAELLVLSGMYGVISSIAEPEELDDVPAYVVHFYGFEHGRYCLESELEGTPYTDNISQRLWSEDEAADG